MSLIVIIVMLRRPNILHIICRICKQMPPEPGKCRCKACADKENAAIQAKRLAKKLAGICRQCNMPVVGYSWFCENHLRLQREHKYEQASKAFEVLDGKCFGCGETERRFLTFDHVENDGAFDRRNNLGPRNIASGIIRGDHLDRIQCLCYNCQRAKQRNDGILPTFDAEWICCTAEYKDCEHHGIYVREEWIRRYKRLLVYRVLSVYSPIITPVCACCGCSNIWYLELDHTDSNGAEERRIIGSGMQFYLHLRRLKYPTGYQTLCANCNQGRQWNNGVCPHRYCSSTQIYV